MFLGYLPTNPDGSRVVLVSLAVDHTTLVPALPLIM